MDIYLAIIAVYSLYQAFNHRYSSLVLAMCYFIMTGWSVVFLVQ